MLHSHRVSNSSLTSDLPSLLLLMLSFLLSAGGVVMLLLVWSPSRSNSTSLAIETNAQIGQFVVHTATCLVCEPCA